MFFTSMSGFKINKKITAVEIYWSLKLCSNIYTVISHCYLNFFTFKHYFDDPEGKIELPASLKYRVKSWKRPAEIFEEQVTKV